MNHCLASRIEPGIAFALASAGLFGASIPFAKVLLGGGVDSWLLAGMLYLGSGVGLAVILAVRHILGVHSKEAPLRRAVIPRLALATAIGGVAAPLLLMWGLARTDAASASLLLSLEGVATLAVAWFVFRENTEWRIVLGAAAILSGAVLVSWNGTPTMLAAWGPIAIALACGLWAIDNNITRGISGTDPIAIAAAKGLAAGTTNALLALTAGAALPDRQSVFAAGALGLVSYGGSLVLFVLALRHLGAARTSAYYSTAPFVGSVLAIVLLGEPVSIRLVLAGTLMAVGTWLHITEAHAHWHSHEALKHEHRHVHDTHHLHAHEDGRVSEGEHAHWHLHDPAMHRHAHYPDLHHRHNHVPDGPEQHRPTIGDERESD